MNYYENKLSLIASPPDYPGPEEDKSISISARLNDWVLIHLHGRGNNFVFKMAVNFNNVGRAGEKLRVFQMLELNELT